SNKCVEQWLAKRTDILGIDVVLLHVLAGKEFSGELVPAEGVTSQRILERVAAVRRT
ncbi:hypothetical protein Droror1_Dr00011260, partial [Drosera rotundifolia]